jgi:DinB family protein
VSGMRTLARPGDAAEILRRLRSVRPESVRRWGRMSAHQMLCHLADSFRMALGEQAVAPAGGPLRRTVVKWFALYGPLPWPPGILTRPELDQEGGGTRPGEFAADAARVEALLERFTAPTRRLDGRRHPTFGPMSDAAWLRWGYLHTNHHLRQFGA